MPYDIKLPIKFPTGEIIYAGINIRPYAIELLKELSKSFEVIVFTASHSCYANVVLNYLDPEGKYIAHRLFREHCLYIDKVHVKDLRVLGRDLSQTVIIDNAAYSFAFQIDNGIPIIPYYEGKIDFELKALQSYL
jgi:CTD small phosphatase-like protein 2